MQSNERGFTIVELMIAVAVIAILASIALPAYNNYRIRSANGACLIEVNAYLIPAVSALRDGEALPAPNAARCSVISTATAGTSAAPGTITATPMSPGDAPITCTLGARPACNYSTPPES